MVNKTIRLIIGLIGLILIISLVLTFFYHIKIKESRSVLGTKVTMTVLTNNQKQGSQLIKMAFNEIERLEKIYSDRRPDSELYQLNQASAHQWIEVSPELASTIDQAFRWHKQTNGLFDITVGTLGKLWGFKSDGQPSLPNANQLEQVTGTIGMDQLDWDRDKRQLRFKQANLQLDLGGIAKLVILQKLKEFFKEHRQERYLVNLGGDVLAGQAAPLKKWTIGLADPKSPQQLVLQLRIEQGLVLSSGNYYRSFKQGKKIFHHIFNPHTGYPSTAVQAATLVMPNDCNQPIPSVVIFLLGLENGMTLIEAHPQIEGVIFHDDQLTSSSQFQQYLK